MGGVVTGTKKGWVSADPLAKEVHQRVSELNFLLEREIRRVLHNLKDTKREKGAEECGGREKDGNSEKPCERRKGKEEKVLHLSQRN